MEDNQNVDAFGFGNSNWNDGNNAVPNQEMFNAVNTENAPTNQPAAFDEEPMEDLAFDQPIKGDKVTEIGEDAEEIARIEAAQRDLQEKLRALRDKEEQEMAEKRAIKQRAQEELNAWYQNK